MRKGKIFNKGRRERNKIIKVSLFKVNHSVSWNFWRSDYICYCSIKKRKQKSCMKTVIVLLAVMSTNY